MKITRSMNRQRAEAWAKQHDPTAYAQATRLFTGTQDSLRGGWFACSKVLTHRQKESWL